LDISYLFNEYFFNHYVGDEMSWIIFLSGYALGQISMLLIVYAGWVLGER